MPHSLILFLISFLTINCIVENQMDLELSLHGVINREIGKKGTAIALEESNSKAPKKKHVSHLDYLMIMIITLLIEDYGEKIIPYVYQ